MITYRTRGYAEGTVAVLVERPHPITPGEWVEWSVTAYCTIEIHGPGYASVGVEEIGHSGGNELRLSQSERDEAACAFEEECDAEREDAECARYDAAMDARKDRALEVL